MGGLFDAGIVSLADYAGPFEPFVEEDEGGPERVPDPPRPQPLRLRVEDGASLERVEHGASLERVEDVASLERVEDVASLERVAPRARLERVAPRARLERVAPRAPNPYGASFPVEDADSFQTPEAVRPSAYYNAVDRCPGAYGPSPKTPTPKWTGRPRTKPGCAMHRPARWNVPTPRLRSNSTSYLELARGLPKSTRLSIYNRGMRVRPAAGSRQCDP